MLERLRQRLVRPILSARDGPSAVAGGVALGLFVACTPTVGLQMAIAWVLATVCGANRVVAMAMVWLSNPFTMIPMYYGEYLLGTWLLDRQAVTSYQDFQGAWAAMAELGYLERVRSLSDAVLLPLVLGALLPGAVLALLAYPATLRWLKGVAGRRAPGPEDLQAGPASDVRRTAGPASLLVVAGLLLEGCADGQRAVTRAGVPDEPIVEESLALWYAWDGSRLLLVGPLELVHGQGEFTDGRLDSLLGRPDLSYQVLRILMLGPEGSPLPLGGEGLAVTVEGGEGRSRSVEPSRLLDRAPSPGSRGLLAALLGAGPLPVLAEGKGLMLILAFEGPRPSPESFSRVSVELPDRTVDLTPLRLPAEQLDAAFSQPSLEAMTAHFPRRSEAP